MPDNMYPTMLIKKINAPLTQMVLSSSRYPLDLDTMIVIYNTSITVHFHSAPLIIPVLNISSLFPDLQSLTLMPKVHNP